MVTVKTRETVSNILITTNRGHSSASLCLPSPLLPTAVLQPGGDDGQCQPDGGQRLHLQRGGITGLQCESLLYVFVCVCAYMYMYMHCMYVHVCMYVCMYECMYVDMNQYCSMVASLQCQDCENVILILWPVQHRTSIHVF